MTMDRCAVNTWFVVVIRTFIRVQVIVTTSEIQERAKKKRLPTRKVLNNFPKECWHSHRFKLGIINYQSTELCLRQRRETAAVDPYSP